MRGSGVRIPSAAPKFQFDEVLLSSPAHSIAGRSERGETADQQDAWRRTATSDVLETYSPKRLRKRSTRYFSVSYHMELPRPGGNCQRGAKPRAWTAVCGRCTPGRAAV